MYDRISSSCNNLQLIKIKTSKEDSQLLYEILKERDKKNNISHKIMPTFKEHINFVKSSPYRYWFFIKKANNLIGSTYITYNNEITVILLKKNKNNFINTLKLILTHIKPLRGIASRRNQNFTLNLAPNNRFYIDILDKLGQKKIQETFLLQL